MPAQSVSNRDKALTAVDVRDVEAQVITQAGIPEHAVGRNAQGLSNRGLCCARGRGSQRQDAAAGHMLPQQASQSKIC